MHDSLWDQSPIIQRMKAATKAEVLQDAIVDVVNGRFPHLADLARQRVTQINDEENLRGLLVQVSNATDETSMRLLLVPTVA